jgi:peptide/nickel transport system substrate-binding protein
MRNCLSWSTLGLVIITLLGVACGPSVPAAPATSTTAPAGQATSAPSGSTAAAGAPTTTSAVSATTAPTASAPVAASGTAASSDTLRVVEVSLGTQSLDAIAVTEAPPAAYLIYEPLLRYDDKGNLIPWLAKSWSMSDDGKVWTFNLRQGVKWQNGEDFTSADVKFSLERYISPDSLSAWAPMQRNTVDHIETPDDYTVVVDAKAVNVFYGDFIVGAFMTPKNYFDKVGAEAFAKQPIGTGPWKMSSFTPGANVQLDAYKDYWGNKPAWDKLELLQVPEESTRLAMIKRGEVDITPVSNDNAIALRDAGYQLRQTRSAAAPAYYIPGYWLSKSPTSDVRVREAMDIAINRQEIVDSFFERFGKPTVGSTGLDETHWGFDPIWYTNTYDPDRARQLLKDAGYPDKFSDPVVQVYSTVQGSFSSEPELVQLLVAYWDAVGLKTQVVPIDNSAMRSAWIALDPKTVGVVVPWVGGTRPNNIAGQQNNMTTKGINVASDNAEIDTDYAAMLSELDPAKRLALWQTIQEKAFALHSVVGIARTYQQYAVSDKVGEWAGMDFNVNGYELGLTDIKRR